MLVIAFGQCIPTVSKRFCVKRQELFLGLGFLEEFEGRKKKTQLKKNE